jgi:2-alkyl-3-oxoalkanoate reductase
MRVFVAGATGVIGRALVPKLMAAGHQVTGMTRSEERAAGLRSGGAAAVVADALDAAAVSRALVESRPEVVVHQLTSLPAAPDFKDEHEFDATNRLRSEGTRILVDAALQAGARRLVAQSIAFQYAPEGDWVKDENAPRMHGDGGISGVMRAIGDLERTVTTTEGIDGLVLRYAFFYGPGSAYAPDGAMADEVRRRRFPIVGKGNGVFSFIHVDDAAEATVAAVERGAPGIYNISDDEPAPMREWLPVFAEWAGAKPPLRVPGFVARLVAGKQAAASALGMRGASNAKAKRELGWSPRHPSWRTGFG